MAAIVVAVFVMTTAKVKAKGRPHTGEPRPIEELEPPLAE
jgi:hypothetical protein